jgi:hypothetical protein
MLLTKNDFADKIEVVMDGRPAENKYDVDEVARQLVFDRRILLRTYATTNWSGDC